MKRLKSTSFLKEENMKRLDLSHSSFFPLLILKPFHKVLDLYFLYFNFCTVVSGSELSQKELEKIELFRRQMYQLKHRYLIPSNKIEIEREREIDKRSYHLIVYGSNQEIVASVRMTPYPFEITSVLGESKTKDYDRYLEISRLICRNPKSGIGNKLLIRAGLFAIRNKNYDGLVAICKSEKINLFQSFGLKTIHRFKYECRGNTEYHFICSSFLNVSQATLKKLLGKLSIQRLFIKNKAILNKQN